MKRLEYLDDIDDNSKWKSIDENIAKVKEFSLGCAYFTFLGGLGTMEATNYFLQGRYGVGIGFSAATLFCGSLANLSRNLAIKNANERNIKGFYNIERFNVIREQGLVEQLEKETPRIEEPVGATILPFRLSRKKC